MSEEKVTKKKFKDLNIHFKIAYVLAGAAAVSGVGGSIDMLCNTIDYGLNDVPANEAFYASAMSSEEYQQYINDITNSLYEDYKAGKISYLDFNNQVAELKESYKISEYIKNSDNGEWHQGLDAIEQKEVKFEERLGKDFACVTSSLGMIGVGSVATLIGTIVDRREEQNVR